MLTIAYLANQFPSSVEPYVVEEIEELRRRGVRVIAGSVRPPVNDATGPRETCRAEITLLPLDASTLLRGLWLSVRRWKRISPLIMRVVFRGREGPLLRMKALLHTWLGACYAVRLRNRRIAQIHAHHGYFGSWIALVAARLLDAGFSMTLHGSDLLLHATYLDVKLENCRFCLTVSEFNRRYILEHHPEVVEEKVLVSRLGVEVRPEPICLEARNNRFTLLAVGRLHRVKDHAFLVRACAQLRARGLRFECSIAGEGPERRRLESLIRKYSLEKFVTLLGHVPREQIDSLYARADVVLLTSRSEGLPLVLMEAMARGKIVLAPAITGIPELVIPGKTGFLFESGSQADFVARLLFIHSLNIHSEIESTDGQCNHDRPNQDRPRQARPNILSAARQLDWVRHAAQVQVRHYFNRNKNLELFVDLFLQRVTPRTGSIRHEDSVLQQIQLSVQRHRGVPV